MLYLLDANILIDAARDYYALDMVPGFWSWLLEMGTRGSVKIPLEVYEEITPMEKLFKEWIGSAGTKASLLLDGEVDPSLLQLVLAKGYGDELTEDELETVGRDPFLIAYALKRPDATTIVTSEASKPKKTRANRHVPDVCTSLNVLHCRLFHMTRALGFRV